MASMRDIYGIHPTALISLRSSKLDATTSRLSLGTQVSTRSQVVTSQTTGFFTPAMARCLCLRIWTIWSRCLPAFLVRLLCWKKNDSSSWFQGERHDGTSGLHAPPEARYGRCV